MSLDSLQTIINNRYKIEAKLGEGGMGSVYRATDRLTGNTVAVKRVTTPGEQLILGSMAQTSDYRLALAQEFRILASLRHPNIISVLDYGFDVTKQPFFTMELLDDALTVTDYGRSRSYEQKVDLVTQILQAIAYLHRHGIIHRDLKPDNTLVFNNQVKVLDFGLAIAREHMQVEDQLVGTIAYMAPEILFQNSPQNEASDLYAVGMIAYQLFADHYPFDTRNLNQLMRDISETNPDISMTGDNPALQSIIARLLAKSPNQRFQHAVDVLYAFEEMTGEHVQYETATIRESYLQAARFVGRQEEYEQLAQSIESLITHQRGTSWLIGGESGVGKSRFADELRILALVKGAQVLQGQAIAENSAPFWTWRSVLRRLCLSTELSDFQAGVLKGLVPDLELLINRPVRDAEAVDPQAAQLRLITVIEDVFLMQRQATVLLLEDLQWEDEGIEILKRLVRITSRVPLVIIATYRDDERPDLPNELSHMHLIRLKPFDLGAISELSASIVGDNGRRAGLIEILRRETEGNVLFIVEMIRMLAEEAGQLSRIDTASIPSVNVSGGAILQRRLSRIPAYAQDLLRIAAVAGRELDLDVLQSLSPDTNLNYWLDAVSNMVEVQDNRYRFSHNKLREGLVASLSTDQQEQIHHDLALALEAVHPENHALLAYHWRESRQPEKELPYARSAGLKALEVGSFRVASTFLERANELMQRFQHPPREQAFLKYQLGLAAISMGQTLKAVQHYETALAMLGFSAPATPGQTYIKMMKAVIRQIWHRIRLDILQSPLKEQSERYELPARVASAIGIPYSISGNTLMTLYTLINSINWSERAGDTAHDVAFIGHTFTGDLFALSLPRLGAVFSRRANWLRPRVNSRKAIGEVQRNSALLVAASGDWRASTHRHEESVRIAEEIGDMRLWLTTHSLHLVMAYFFEPEWAGLITSVENIRDVAARQDDLQIKGLAIGMHIILLLHRGSLEEAQSLRDHNQAFLDSLDEPGALRYVCSATVQLLRRHGQAEEALVEADKLLALMPTVPAEPIFLFFLHILGELFFTLWERDLTPDLQTRAQQLLKMLKTYAQLYPIGKPMLALYSMWWAGISKDSKGILRQGEKALRLAQHYQMPLSEGLAHYQMARFHPGGHTHRQIHLRAAKAIFERLNESWYMDEINAQLSTQ